MEKKVLIIACCLIFSGCCQGDKGEEQKEHVGNTDMETLVDNISDLAAKVLEIFEPIASKAKNGSDEDHDNTYFVSFLLKDRRNKTEQVDSAPRQRMVVNNNFSGEKMGTNQVFVESGQAPKQPPSHNIQLLNNPAPQYAMPSQGYNPAPVSSTPALKQPTLYQTPYQQSNRQSSAQMKLQQQSYPQLSQQQTFG